MPNYRRNYLPGGTFFFTLTLQDRNSDLLVKHIQLLRTVVGRVKRERAFHIDAWVALPDHLHAIWTLLENDSDYSGRWRVIKKTFSKSLPYRKPANPVQKRRGERGIWQLRFWEHTIRDELDYEAHVNYVHFNPVKHGWVKQVRDCPYSSFHRYVQRSVYPVDWGGGEADNSVAGEPLS